MSMFELSQGIRRPASHRGRAIPAIAVKAADDLNGVIDVFNGRLPLWRLAVELDAAGDRNSSGRRGWRH
jgi:hypothetical protein